MSVAYLQIKAADMWIVGQLHSIALTVSKMQHQKSLMLC
jgi:hypothetical protein